MRTTNSYSLFEKAIWRTPLYSVDKFYNSKIYEDSIQFMEDHFQDIEFKNGILLSSYKMYDEIQRFLEKPNAYSKAHQEKIFQTFFKYFTRVSTRPTPYGLFSNLGCLSMTNYIDDPLEKNTISDKRYIQIELHFDLLHQIALYLNKKYAKFCYYRINSSLILKPDVIQYTVAENYEGKNIFKTRTIDPNDIIEYLAKNKNKEYLYPNLVSHLSKMFPEYNIDDIESYVQDCIEEAVFYNTSMPSARGDVSNNQFIHTEIKRIIQSNPTNDLESISKIFNSVNDLSSQSDFRTAIDNISLVLNQLNIPHSLDKIIFVNSFKEDNQLPLTYKQISTFMDKAINVLTRFTTLETNDYWYSDFLQAFKSIYGDEMVPFDILFDPITGLSYPLENKKDTEQEILLSEVYIRGKVVDKNIVTAKQKLWFEKYIDCIKNGKEELEFFKKDILKYTQTLPAKGYTFPMLVSVVKDPELKDSNPYLFIKSATAGSALSYLGRFASGNSEIENLCTKIAEFEDSLVAEEIHAEITHVPNPKIGDILFHKPFHKYEIPYLVQSKTNDSNTINIEDLYLGIENDEFVIYSKKHAKYVIPVLSNAYNFSLSEHPAFMFLCEFQHRKSYYSPNLPLGIWVNDRSFFPRIRYENLIFMPKTWTLNKANFDNEKMKDKDMFLDEIRKIIPIIPNRFLIGQGDQQLLIDLENKFSFDLFYNYCSKKFSTKTLVIISEYYEPISDFSNELLLSFGYEKK